MKLFVKNVTDPVGEFWEKKALEQTGGVGHAVTRLQSQIVTGSLDKSLNIDKQRM